MLRTMPGEDQPITAICPLFSDFEPQTVDVEVQRRFQILHEQADRSDLGDGEGPREHYPFYIISGGKVRFVAKAGVDVDALLDRLFDLCLLGHLRQGGLLTEFTVVHCLWLATA